MIPHDPRPYLARLAFFIGEGDDRAGVSRFRVLLHVVLPVRWWPSDVATLALFGEPFFVADRAESLLAREIAMHRADRERRCDRYIGQTKPRQSAPHQVAAGGRRRQTFAEIEMQDSAARVLGLQRFLVFERFERVVGETDRKL